MPMGCKVCFIIPGSQPLEMFTGAIGERTVRQGKEPDFSEPRDPLVQRVQPLSKRHVYLVLQGMDVALCAQSRTKK